MQLPEDCHLAYIVSHGRKYERDEEGVPTVHVGAARASGDGDLWAFTVEEVITGGVTRLRLTIFGEAFAAFAQMPEFFQGLAAGEATTLAQVRALLDAVQ